MQLGKISSLFLRMDSLGDILQVIPVYICPKGTIDLGRPILEYSLKGYADATRITELFQLAEVPLTINEVVETLTSISDVVRRDIVVLEVEGQLEMLFPGHVDT